MPDETMPQAAPLLPDNGKQEDDKPVRKKKSADYHLSGGTIINTRLCTPQEIMAIEARYGKSIAEIIAEIRSTTD